MWISVSISWRTIRLVCCFGLLFLKNLDLIVWFQQKKKRLFCSNCDHKRVVYFSIKYLLLNILTFLWRTLRESTFFIHQLHTSDKKFIKHIFTDQEQSVSIYMNAVNFINCKVSILFKKYFQIITHSKDFRSTTKKYQLITWFYMINYWL